MEGPATVSTGTERSAPTLLYSDIETDLRASVRGLLTDRSPASTVLAGLELEQPYDLGLWRTLAAETGCAGLFVPEQLGGAGASPRETAVVLEELGRAVTPSPFFGSAVLATSALLAAGDTALLPRLAAGEAIAALAVPFSAPPSAAHRLTVRAADGRLTGSVTSVADAGVADVLLVPARDEDGPALYLVQAADADRAAVTSLDQTRPLCDLGFDVTPGERIASGVSAVPTALRTGAALLASEQLGVAERALELTVEYLRTRYQFGRPLGSFQGLKHRLADLWVSLTQARAVARYAADCVAADDPDTPIAASLAQAYVSPVAVKAAEEAVQMHGGIGFTWEHAAHLYLKRAKATSLALGTADWHRAALARQVDLPGSPPDLNG